MLWNPRKTLKKFSSKGGEGGQCNITFSNGIRSPVIPHFVGFRKRKQKMVGSKNVYIDSVQNGGLKQYEVFLRYKLK